MTFFLCVILGKTEILFIYSFKVITDVLNFLNWWWKFNFLKTNKKIPLLSPLFSQKVVLKNSFFITFIDCGDFVSKKWWRQAKRENKKIPFGSVGKTFLVRNCLNRNRNSIFITFFRKFKQILNNLHSIEI